MPDLREELLHRHWLLTADASWDVARERLVVSVTCEVAALDDLQLAAAAVLDELRDCVVACLSFANAVSFDVDSTTPS